MGSKDRTEELSDEERSQMYSELQEAIENDTAQFQQVQSDEEWQSLMPDQSPSIGVRIMKAVVMILLIFLTVSPLIFYLLVGFESALVAFMVAFLFFFVQS